MSNYRVGSYFDRPRDLNRSWEIDTHRMICQVGALIPFRKNGVLMFLNKGSFHYQVTNEILKMAIKLGIKSDSDIPPSQSKLNKYRNFILMERSKYYRE